jgi:mono/diheme cytochrome c family protein
MKRSVRLLALALMALSLTGCMRGCTSPRSPIHINPNMDQQLRVNAQSESDFFYDGQSMRQPIDGTLARGELRDQLPAFYSGMAEDGSFVATAPAGSIANDDAMLERGLRQYTIYCQPCHEKRGAGKGILFEYGSVPMPTFYDERLVAMPDGEMFDTITNGKGLMQGYGYPLSPSDRWAIIAHVRGMQRERAAGGGS